MTGNATFYHTGSNTFLHLKREINEFRVLFVFISFEIQSKDSAWSRKYKRHQFSILKRINTNQLTHKNINIKENTTIKRRITRSGEEVWIWSQRTELLRLGCRTYQIIPSETNKNKIFFQKSSSPLQHLFIKHINHQKKLTLMRMTVISKWKK